MKKTHARWRRWASAALLVLIVALAAASFLPLLESRAWWVRYMDYPRLQLLIALPILLALYLALRQRIGKREWAIGLLTVLAAGYHGSQLYPYTTLAAQEAVALDTCADDSLVSILVANVKEGNESSAEFLQMVPEVAPDILLVMETDQWWDRELSETSGLFTDRRQHIPEDEGDFGMHLFSNLKLISPEFKFFFGAYTPTMVTGIRLPNGEAFQFIGVHPRPPIPPSQSTMFRDAHLLTVALEARESELPTVVAGDLNSVPWEDVTRRMLRLRELLDPRLGRGLYPTFSARSPVMSWPLDHVLYQEQFGLVSFAVLPGFGSDHYPVLVSLCLSSAAADLQSASAIRDSDMEEANTVFAAARAEDTEGDS